MAVGAGVQTPGTRPTWPLTQSSGRHRFPPVATENVIRHGRTAEGTLARSRSPRAGMIVHARSSS